MMFRLTSLSRNWMALLAWLAAALCVLPIAAVTLAALSGGMDTVGSLAQTVLPRYTVTTLGLVVIVAIGTGTIGTGAAWLVTMTRFPGRRLLEIALALPLAFPAYVLAYAYTDFLDHPGWVQTTLRDLMGWGPREYWFPEIRSLPGAAAMLTLVLYPYVYLLVRAAFLQQSATAFLAARALGQSAWRTFFRVSLPMARPAIAGGVLLAVMETIADYGTVAHFGVQTFSTGIIRSWISFTDRTGAAQLALVLLVFALVLAWLERKQRGEARHHGAGRRHEAMAPMSLSRLATFGAILFCGIPVLLGFLLPVGLLLWMGWDHFYRLVPDWILSRFIETDGLLLVGGYLDFLRNSALLAAAGAGLTVIAAVALSSNARLFPTRHAQTALLIAGVGYAVPGAVIALGLLVPFAAFDNALDAFMEANFGIDTGLLITGSIWLMVLAYVVRFMAAALGAYGSGLAQVNPNIDAVARTLGQTPQRTILGLHLPMLKPSVFTALLIVFVDVMKELPATLVMRPFNWDTLAVQAHRLASDERLHEAAVPSLVIAAVGLLPVIVLCRGLGQHQQMPTSDMPDPVKGSVGAAG
ncbi:iron ABC transporter permease [Rhodobacteraceae bacterium W635]|nr:iron ABC transporter permease [Rhodobacteraceae bacterium W635]